VLLSAYKAQRTSPIAIDENIVKEVQEASDRATRYGILPKKLDVNAAVDRSFTVTGTRPPPRGRELGLRYSLA
jgi:sulfonate transport system substrate-binding protein